MSKQKKPSNEPQSTNGTKRWSAEEKLRVVSIAATLEGNDLGHFLRSEGLRAADAERFRTEALAGLAAPQPRALTAEKRRIAELERELSRKEKALAETAALLVLRKKADALWGAEVETTQPNKER